MLSDCELEKFVSFFNNTEDDIVVVSFDDLFNLFKCLKNSSYHNDRFVYDEVVESDEIIDGIVSEYDVNGLKFRFNYGLSSLRGLTDFELIVYNNEKKVYFVLGKS